MAKTYSDVKILMRQSILDGTYQPNDRLPAAEELSVQLKTSRLTVHRALRELAAEGLVHRAPGRGTVVADPSRHMVGTVALVMPELHMAGRAAELYGAIASELTDAGLTLVPYSSHCSARRAAQLARHIIMTPPRGVIFAPPSFEDSREIVDIFQSADIPVVISGKFELPDLDVSYVSSNHRQGGRILAEHLLGVGHRDFAVISASAVQDAIERRDGFCEVLNEAGFPIDDNAILNVRRLNEIPYVIEELMRRSIPPTAIFGLNDIISAEIMVALKDMGLKIPQDCAVVGIGDEPWCRALISPLTTAHSPLEKEGHLLAGILLDSIRGTLKSTRRIEVGYDLIVRESCGVNSPRNVKQDNGINAVGVKNKAKHLGQRA